MRPLFIGAMLLLVWVVTLNAAKEHNCIHDLLVHNQVSKRNQVDGGNQQSYLTSDMPTQDNTQPIRFAIDPRYLDVDTDYTCYSAGQVITTTDNPAEVGPYTCTAADVLSADTRTYLLNVLIPGALVVLENTFHVVPVQGNLFLQSGDQCGAVSVTVPSDYETTGLPATDLLVFVTSRPTPTSGALAYAISCQDDQFNRAVAGTINIDPKSVSTDPGDYYSQRGTVMHELTHVLGLSSSKWGLFRGLSQSDVTQTNNNIVTIITPLVVAFTQKYFNCDSLAGALLEDGGAGGTVGSHWEKEQWMNEYMTGQSTQNPVFSALTLSLLQDSGWYYINYELAEPMLWGYQQGCNFASSCSQWPSGNGYACTTDQTNIPTFDLQAKGYCGGDELTNCNYIKGYSDGWCIDLTYDSNSILNTGEEYCNDCRLFSSSLIKNTPTGGPSQLICYKTACVDSNTLKVWVDDFWYDCDDGDDVEVAAINYGGSIDCPKASLICAERPSNASYWPVITIISPDTGLPGSTITIFGTKEHPPTLHTPIHII
jgi:leishmanolysin